jgi:hypothetical protein
MIGSKRSRRPGLFFFGGILSWRWLDGDEQPLADRALPAYIKDFFWPD